MKRTKLLISCIILLFLNYNCSKKEVKPLTFREAIIGKWEVRETFEAINNLEKEWRPATPPYISLSFEIDSSYTRYRDCSIVLREGTYTVSETDSLIQIFIPFLNTLKPKYFTNDSFINEFMTDEGIVKHKYFKVE